MKFSIPREDLLPALQTVTGVVERRQTLPILSNLLLSINGESILLTTTDMEVELVAIIKKKLSEKGEATLPARKLLDICRTLPDEAVLNFEINGDKALLTSGKSRFTLATLPPQEFPSTDISGSTWEFSISEVRFKSLLDRTAFAMACS